MIRRICILVLTSALLAGTTGCAGGIQRFIVATRNHQGDLAVDGGNLGEASHAYRLALQVEPDDTHARAGLANVQTKLAEQQYRASRFDDALASLEVAAKYDPLSVRVVSLRSDIEQARVKREIVLSNYPTYRETGKQIRHSYTQLKTMNATVVSALQRFEYSYDSNELSKAIRGSYALSAEVNKLTNRLVGFRQLVESGAPTRAADQPLEPAASLLPLP